MKAAATRRFVLDASVAAAWCFADESTKFTENILDQVSAGAEALVPSLWPLELANALLVAERRNRIAMSQVSALLKRMAELPISVMSVDAAHAFDRILPLARQQALSLYDAAYLELALTLGIPLATLDNRLRTCARETGVPLVLA